MIQLTEKLAMIADDSCYIIGKPRQRADKGLVMDNPTYYSTAAQAVRGALGRAMRQTVKNNEVTTLQEFIQEQERLCAELERLIAPLDSGQPRQSVVNGHLSAEPGKDMPQDLDSEKEA